MHLLLCISTSKRMRNTLKKLKQYFFIGGHRGLVVFTLDCDAGDRGFKYSRCRLLILLLSNLIFKIAEKSR